MSRIYVVAWLSVVAISSADAASGVPSGHRAALLLGNSKYDGFTLQGVGKSLDSVEEAIEAQGFHVRRHENLNEKDLKAAVEEFAKVVPTNGVALVYYIGLGAHVERLGKWYNLLRPVGEKIESDNDYRSRGLDVSRMIELLGQQSGSRVNLVFLDACWQSPLQPEKGNVFGGLREFDVDDDTFVIFAAGSRKAMPAPTGDSASALAISLSKHVAKLEDSRKQVGDSIAADAENPWFHASQQSGIGKRSALPVAEAVREGKVAGEGLVNYVGMTFRWCPPGSFTMGSNKKDTPDTRDREPVQVTLSQGFWMGEHEVTQREYSLVMKKNVPIGFTVHKNAPFWGVTESKQITEFCKKFGELEDKAGTLPTGWEYGCPTEAEWEYACRAGSTGAFCFGDSQDELGLYGNVADKSLYASNPNYYWAQQRTDDGVGEALAPVGSYRPNAWGLRDMHGNVVEVVADDLQPKLPGGTDPLVRLEKDGNTQIRGGAWCSLPLYCESSFRNVAPGRDKHNFIGFRIVLKKVK